MVVVHEASSANVEVHQLLCGREIAKTAQPVFSFAAQMANYIYVIVCKRTKKAVIIDPCWDINGLLKYCKDQINVSEVIDYLAGPILKHIGTIYDSKNKIRVIHLSTRKVSSAFFTHRHFDHTGGKLPRAMVGGRDIRLEGLKDIVDEGIEVGYKKSHEHSCFCAIIK